MLDLLGPPRAVVVVTGAPLTSGGALVTIEDVTERSRLDAVKTDFVANVSHELKTPVGAIAVLAEALVDETDPAVIHRFGEKMMAEAHRVGRTIDDLLELSRIELGGEPVSQLVDMRSVVDEAVEGWRTWRALAASRCGPPTSPDRSTETCAQLVSAVGNLVENAVKYSEDGTTVHVTCTESDGWMDIAVVDTGVGIPVKDLDRIFERFYRVVRARSRVTGGTGLGPRDRPAHRVEPRRRRQRHQSRGRGLDVHLEDPGRGNLVQGGWIMTTPTVFVVEDEESFVDALSLGLTREGFHVEVARDGAEALARFDEVQPDLVLLDVMLPKISGIDVCRQLRKRTQVPIIMVTAKGAEIDTVVGLEVGADDYVSKPYRMRELVARMRAVMRRNGTSAPAPAATTTDVDDSTALVVGDVSLDPDRHEVLVRGRAGAVAAEGVRAAARAAGQRRPRPAARDADRPGVGSDYVGDTKTLDVHVKRLRAKVETDPAAPTRIVTIRGLGYKYDRPRA